MPETPIEVENLPAVAHATTKLGLYKQLQPLTQLQVDRLTSFEDTLTLLECYDAMEWDPREEILMLIKIARSNDNTVTEQMRALRQIQKRRREILEANGLMVTASQSSSGSGSRISTSLVATVINPSLFNNQQKGIENAEEEISEQNTEEPQAGDTGEETSDTPAEQEAGDTTAGDGGQDPHDVGHTGTEDIGDTGEGEGGAGDQQGREGTPLAVHRPPKSIILLGGISTSGKGLPVAGVPAVD